MNAKEGYLILFSMAAIIAFPDVSGDFVAI
jgi:hypothetical protein|nr:MAG TPA: Protein of unknown function (DUF2547) [Caudoviricetes sp.]DAM00952.1 MAG TPA: Protein of unknown function (DUF2547) [Caudoviricetes sp.]